MPCKEVSIAPKCNKQVKLCDSYGAMLGVVALV